MDLYYRIACRTSVMETTAVPFNGTGKLGKMSERGNKFTEAAEGHFSGTLTNASLQALLCESCGAEREREREVEREGESFRRKA